MAAQVLQGLFCCVVALLHYVTPAPVTETLTSLHPANKSKSTQNPVTSSETAVNFTTTFISTTMPPSTVITTSTSTKDQLFVKLNKVKDKVAKMASKLDGNTLIKDVKTIPKSTTLKATLTSLTSTITAKTSLPTLSKTDGKLATMSTTAVYSADVTSQSTPVAKPTNSTVSQDEEEVAEDAADAGKEMEEYEDEYDGEEDWFTQNEHLWDFDDKSFEEEYADMYDLSSGDKYRQSLIEETKMKTMRLPWE